jgi:hypothetical protein
MRLGGMPGTDEGSSPLLGPESCREREEQEERRVTPEGGRGVTPSPGLSPEVPKRVDSLQQSEREANKSSLNRSSLKPRVVSSKLSTVARTLARPAKIEMSLSKSGTLFTVHVRQALRLGSLFARKNKSMVPINSYVKVTLIDPNNGSQVDTTVASLEWRTDIITNSKSPVYDEKFQFAESYANGDNLELEITVWCRDLDNGKSELLGAVCVQVQDIQASTESFKWYTLLSQSYYYRRRRWASKRTNGSIADTTVLGQEQVEEEEGDNSWESIVSSPRVP